VHRASARGLEVVAHVILGLPGEGPREMAATAAYLAGLPVQGVKIHLLYVIRGSGLARLYEVGEYQCLTQDEYVSRVVDFIELLPPRLVIHRLTGDPHPGELLAPDWCRDKARVLRAIREEFARRGSRQGSRMGKKDLPLAPGRL
jgi:radical SAM protein (TIGR01212 family)